MIQQTKLRKYATTLDRGWIRMPENLELMIDKFIFRIATDRVYSRYGLWVKKEDLNVRLGISDYLQQRSGDIAFVEAKPVGTQVKVGDEIAVVETIKVNISIASPVSGKVVKINPLLETTPEAINQDPYDSGWFMLIETEDWQNDFKTLIDAQTYFENIKAEAEEEIGSE
jgi:glycine cleavage system H protein